MIYSAIDAVARFDTDWQHSHYGERLPPQIDDYVPDGRQIRVRVLTELVRIDMRRRWERKGRGKRIAEYREEFPELNDSPQLVDLVCAEFLTRRERTPLPVTDFLAEYPDLADRIGERLTGSTDDVETISAAETSEVTAALAELTPGRRIDDFDLLTDLGTGPLGRVFLARQRSMQRLVAVRFSAGRADTPLTMAQLDHPHIVRIFDQRMLGIDATRNPTVAGPPHPGRSTGTRVPLMSSSASREQLGADDTTVADRTHTSYGQGLPGLTSAVSDTTAPTTVFSYLVYMQYLPGGTADVLLEQRRHGPISDGGRLLLRAVDTAMEAKGEIRPSDSSVRAEIAQLSWPETIAWIGGRLADALDYAEHHGVLHHDIKPANILFTAEGIPKLADFALDESGGRTTTTHQTTTADALAYRSPEQLARYLDHDAQAPDNRSDIYSLGVLLWELLTGASPFDDPPPEQYDTAGDMYAGMLAVRCAGVGAAALARLPEETPAALRRVLLDCLHADPARRWRSGAELAAQLQLCLDTHARDLVDPPPESLAYRARGWLLPLAALCVGVPNVLASVYNIRLNQNLIIERMSAADQDKFETVGLINNLIAFPLAAVLLVFLTWRPLTLTHLLARGRQYSTRTLAKARRDTLLMGDWAVWVPFGFWVLAGIIWPLGLALSGVDLPPRTFVHFFTAQVVCAAIALAYPFFPITVYALHSIYPQLLARGEIGPDDRNQLRALAGRGNFYLGVAASVPLLGVASATFVAADDLPYVIVPVRILSVSGILAFVLTYRLFRVLEADLLALTRAIPQRTR
ncbi:serine/threonine-protein kinase [Nocardia sp. 004]|uniref:serine/threonine-protein kinase n=1 Tax=Nocardia sp. 004 TaxID=3385978 RepID=UPI0039A1854D